MTTQPNVAVIAIAPTKSVLMDWIKDQLDNAAFVGAVSLDDLCDLEQHILELASAIV